MAAATRPAGTTIVIEAPAGNGKSRLLTVAGDLARQAGMQVLGAHASELEQDFSFGVAIQLLEPRWASTDPTDRAALHEGSTGAAAALLDGALSEAAQSAENRGYPLIHSLFSLVVHLTSEGPLAILLDDAQWTDRPSLRFLTYLTDRLAEMPIVLVTTLRQGEPAADGPALSALKSAPAAQILTPRPLTEQGVETVVRSEFRDADEAFVEACASVCHGNPQLLVEMLAQVRADELPPDSAIAERLGGVAPAAIVNSVTARLGTMPTEARQLACAVSVLGDGARLRHAARLARLDPETAAHAADGLAAVHMLRSGAPLSFVNPMIRAAVAASMTPLLRAESHRRAAATLREEGLPLDAVAAHLLHSPSGSDPEDVRTLRHAADNALASGSAASAARLLQRALAEKMAPGTRAEILAELGRAEALQDLPQAPQRLSEAIDLTDSPRRRAELTLILGRTLHGRQCYEQAAETLDRVGNDPETADQSLAAEVEGAYISAASLVPARVEDARARSDRFLRRLSDPPERTQRSALAHIVAMASWRGQPRGRVRELADLAWSDGVLLTDEPVGGPSWPLLAAALMVADDLERSVEICDAALAETGSPAETPGVATPGHVRAWPLYHQGHITRASADARAALDCAPDDSQMYVGTAYGVLACCELERGRLEQAETCLAGLEDDEVRDSVRHPLLLEVRAQLRLAQHRPEDARGDAIAAGDRLSSEFGCDHPGTIAWRSTAALAHLALGDAKRAHDLAMAELELAEGLGVTRAVIRDLRIAGLAVGGTAGIEMLRDAVRTGEQYPARLEYIYALVDLGAALRRANERSSARDPLRKGLELSHRGGMTALAKRARDELNATGARPRREMLSGVESLTPSERRVADFAARGLTTRQMAEALFVTPKTVEYHLRHIYQKLDISARSDLPDVLGGGSDDAPGRRAA